MSEEPINITDSERIVLKTMMDLIVPPIDDLPGA